MSARNDWHPDTRTVHTPVPDLTGSRSLGVPIHQNHLFAFDDSDAMADSFAGPGGPYVYGRMGNPTVHALEQAVADLEGGVGGIATGSGMGAINAVLLSLLRSGDHVIAQRCLYGATMAMLNILADRWGVEVTYISGEDPAEVSAALRPNTRVLYLETITNPTVRVADLPAHFAIAKQAGVVCVVDNTYASPTLCRPIEHGADVVVHSITKYISGHGDVLGGVAVFADGEMRHRVWEFANELGPNADPFAAWLTIRGLQTLPLRVRRHCGNALSLATRLSGHPAVSSVAYPGLPGHPDHKVAARLLDGGYGGVLSFELTGGREAGRRFCSALRLISVAASLGSTRTLALHPASTSHRQLDDAQLAAADISPGLIRIAVGIEDPEDLWRDLAQALDAAG